MGIKYSGMVLLLIVSLSGCTLLKKSKRPYEYGWLPKNFKEIQAHYDKYVRMLGCRKGETIASIGAGNGTTEVAISCFVDRIDWYLQEIDSARLFEFHRVREHFEKLYGKKTEANFNMVLGTESSTNLPESTFDRIIMVNVYHELTNREAMMNDISKLLKQNGKLVIMEPMAKQAGDLHASCKHLKLYEPDFLQEMHQFGFKLSKRDVGEKISLVTYYTFLYK